MMNKVLVIFLLCAGAGLAQRGGGGRGGGDTGAIPQMGGVQSKSDTIAAVLNLTKDQKKAVKTILDEGAKAATPVRDQLSKSRLAAGEAILAKKSDDDVRQAAKSSAELSAQLSQVELQTFAKIFASLNEAQKADQQGIARVLAMMNGIYRNKNWNEE
jgi:imidazolonepropionase-like amidohydrolase